MNTKVFTRRTRKQVFRGHEGAGQRHAAFVPAGERGEVGFGIEPELVDGFEDVAVALPAVAGLQQVVGQHPVGGGKLILAARGDEVGGGERLAFLAEAGGHDAEDGAAPVLGHGLRHVPERDARRADDGAAVRREIAREQGHQGGFADAVAPDEADPFSLFDVQVRLVEQRLAAEVERNAL